MRSSAIPTPTSQPEPATTSDPRERRIGGSYVLVGQIGGGATGTVWRALDESTGEQVAVKLLGDDLAIQPKVVMRFVQERALLTSLRHDNTSCRSGNLLTVGQPLGLVMDLIPGGSLRHRLRAHGTLPPAEVATIMAGVSPPG